MPTQTLTASNMAGLLAAIDTAAAQPGTDWIIQLADGDYGTGQGKTFISSKVFSGRVVDPNAGLRIDQRNPQAVARVVGGSVTIRARNPMKARVTDLIQVTGSGPFAFVGLDFTAHANADGGRLPDGSYRKSESHVKAQLQHTSNATHPAQTGMVVAHCRFGGAASGTAPARWIMGATLAGNDNHLTVVEDCAFEGATIACSAVVMRRNVVENQVTDAFRMAFGKGPQPGLFCYGNTILNSYTGPEFDREHCDAVQVGSVNTDNPVWIEVYDNVIASAKKMQGIYCDDSKASIGGYIGRNLIAVTNTNGINLWRADNLTVEGNTVMRFPDGVATHRLVLTRVSTTGTSAVLRGNVSMNDPTDPIKKPWLTVTGHKVVAFKAAAYNAAFMGNFGTGPAPLAAIDFTQSAAALRASLLAMFAPRAAA
jgi:hypothetical protein